MRHRNAGFKLGRNTSHRRALLAQPGHVRSRRRPRRDHRGQGQGCSSARRKDDHPGQEGRSALAPSGAQLSHDRQGRHAAVRHRGSALRRSRRAAICASSAPASRRATAPRRPSSNCSAPRSSSTSSARSAPTSRPRSAPSSKSSSKREEGSRRRGRRRGRLSIRLPSTSRPKKHAGISHLGYARFLLLQASLVPREKPPDFSRRTQHDPGA